MARSAMSDLDEDEKPMSRMPMDEEGGDMEGEKPMEDEETSEEEEPEAMTIDVPLGVKLFDKAAPGDQVKITIMGTKMDENKLQVTMMDGVKVSGKQKNPHDWMPEEQEGEEGESNMKPGMAFLDSLGQGKSARMNQARG